MSGHNRFLVLSIEQSITMIPVSDPNQPVLGDLSQGKPPNIEAMNHGGSVFLDRNRTRDIGAESGYRHYACVEHYHGSGNHTNRYKHGDNLGGDRTNEPDNNPKLRNKGY